MTYPDPTYYEAHEYHTTQMERQAKTLIAELKARNPEFMSTTEVIAGIRNDEDVFGTGDDPFMAICEAMARQPIAYIPF